MKLNTFLTVSCLLMGCSAASPEASESTAHAVTADQNDARFDFRVSGDGLDVWEGKQVFSAALENHWEGTESVSVRVVNERTTVVGGAFQVLAEEALHTNYGYPSFAVLIDVDGDGKCSDGDMVYFRQFYGWSSAIEDSSHGPSAFVQKSDIQGGPIGGTSFCGAFFDQ